MLEEVTTIDELRRSLALKALNKARGIPGAAALLGVSDRTLIRWKKNYRIGRCPVTREYFIKSQPK